MGSQAVRAPDFVGLLILDILHHRMGSKGIHIRFLTLNLRYLQLNIYHLSLNLSLPPLRKRE